MDLFVEDSDVWMAASAQVDAHGDCSDIQVLVGHHLDGFKYLFRMYRHVRFSSDSVHEAENIFMLNDNLNAQLFSDGGHGFLEGRQIESRGLDLGLHDHREKVIHDGLPDIGYIDAVFGHYPADAGNDAHTVQSYDRNDETTR